MTKFAFCDQSEWVRQFDTATPSELPFAVHRATTNVHNIAFTADNEFALVWGPGAIEIRKTTGPKTENHVYKHALTISTVRLRTVGGTQRIYFSALKAASQPGPQYYNIYYLTLGPLGYVPTLYTTIDPTQLKIPNPCNPSVENWYWYSGDFVFGDNDTLYLASGNLGSTPVGIYRVDGAGPDTVTGTPVRIHLSEGPIWNLCYKAPSSLFFTRGNFIWKFDLSSMGESFEGAVPVKPGSYVIDIAEVGNGLPKQPWWTFYSVIAASLAWVAAAVAKAGDALHIAGGRKSVARPETPPR